jgi:hypothetical protein
VRRSDIDFDQDDDDPSEVEVDLDTVMDALKDLARRKPHLVVKKGSGNGKSDGGDGKPAKSGSKGAGKGGDKTKTTEETLKTKYPALGRR